MSVDLAEIQEQSFARAGAATRAAFPPQRRLPGEDLMGYLDRRQFAVVGSTRPDGRAHAAVASYVRLGADFWLPTVAGSVREKSVRSRPWLTLTVTEGDRGDHVVVLLEGPVSVVPADEAPAELRQAVPDRDWVSCWLRLSPARVLSYCRRQGD